MSNEGILLDREYLKRTGSRTYESLWISREDNESRIQLETSDDTSLELPVETDFRYSISAIDINRVSELPDHYRTTPEMMFENARPDGSQLFTSIEMDAADIGWESGAVVFRILLTRNFHGKLFVDFCGNEIVERIEQEIRWFPVPEDDSESGESDWWRFLYYNQGRHVFHYVGGGSQEFENEHDRMYEGAISRDSLSIVLNRRGTDGVVHTKGNGVAGTCGTPACDPIDPRESLTTEVVGKVWTDTDDNGLRDDDSPVEGATVLMGQSNT